MLGRASDLQKNELDRSANEANAMTKDVMAGMRERNKLESSERIAGGRDATAERIARANAARNTQNRSQ